MYGRLTYSEDRGLKLTLPIWKVQETCSEEELKSRRHDADQFVKQECAKDTQEQREQIQADLRYIVPHVLTDGDGAQKKEDFDFALYMCRAHNILIESQRRKRRKVIKTAVDGIFADLKSPSKDQREKVEVLKRIGKLMPDGFQRPLLVSLAVGLRRDMLVKDQKAPENEAISDFLRQLYLVTLDPKADDATRKRQSILFDSLSNVWLSRPFGEWRENSKQQLIEALSSKKHEANVFLAHEKALIAAPHLFPGEIWNALDAIIDELLSSEEKPQDIIDEKLGAAVSRHRSHIDKAFRATAEAHKRGDEMGKTGTDSREALKSFREHEDKREAMAEHLQALKKKAPQKPKILIPGEKEDIDPFLSWAVGRVACLIDGPVIEQGQKGSITKKIQDKEMEEKARQRAPNTQSKKPPSISVVDNARVIQDALSVTARLFLDEIRDMLPLIPALKAIGVMCIPDCEWLMPGLENLANPSGVFNEEAVCRELVNAEDAIQEQRKRLWSWGTSTLVRNNFRGQLSMALNNEKMFRGKRNGGGRILCHAKFNDWSYVVNNFHNRWVPLVDGDQTTQLDEDQAVALYVTGSSQSGHAFDVSVHLWRRRAGRTSAPNLPSDESSVLFPPMNEVDWYDTRIPYCVLHVPLYKE